MSKILIIAEHQDGKLNGSTARCVTCARDLKAESIDVLVLAADRPASPQRPRRSTACRRC